MNLTSQSLVIAREIISLAGKSTTLTEYKQDSLLRKVEPGTSHDDRLRMIKFLEIEGLIRTREDRVELIRGTVPDWIVDFASQGSAEAYSIAEILDPVDNWGVNKFDESVLKQIGLQGEIAFIEHLRDTVDSPKEILHVSLFDDSLGYDVRMTDKEGAESFFEVKTSSRPVSKKFQFYLSRNEYEVSSTLTGWKLACMQISAGRAGFIGFCPTDFVHENAPKDASEVGQWAVVKFKLATGLMQMA